MSTTRILTLNYPPSIGGLQSFAASLATVAQQVGTVEVWTSAYRASPGSADRTRVSQPAAGDVPVWQYRSDNLSHGLRRLVRAIRPRDRSGVQGIAMFPWSPQLIGRTLMRRAAITVVIPSGNLNVLYALLARRLRRTSRVLIVGAHHIGPDWRPTAALTRAIRAADIYVAFTEYERTRVIGATARTGSTVVLPPMGVASSPMPAKRSREHWRDDEEIPREAFVVGLVARHMPYKGFDLLLDALTSTPPNIHAVIAGGATAYTPHLTRRIERYELSARCHLLIDVAPDDLGDVYSALDVVAVLSTEESFGLTILEAWSADLPVIAADHPVLTEVMNGIAGAIVDRSPERLGAELTRLAEDEGALRALREGGRERLLDYAPGQVAARWRDLLMAARASSNAGSHQTPNESVGRRRGRLRRGRRCGIEAR